MKINPSQSSSAPWLPLNLFRLSCDKQPTTFNNVSRILTYINVALSIQHHVGPSEVSCGSKAKTDVSSPDSRGDYEHCPGPAVKLEIAVTVAGLGKDQLRRQIGAEPGHISQQTSRTRYHPDHQLRQSAQRLLRAMFSEVWVTVREESRGRIHRNVTGE